MIIYLLGHRHLELTDLYIAYGCANILKLQKLILVRKMQCHPKN